MVEGIGKAIADTMAMLFMGVIVLIVGMFALGWYLGDRYEIPVIRVEVRKEARE